MPDLREIQKARLDDLALVGHYNFVDDPASWEQITEDFVISRKNKKRVSLFVSRMHAAKISTERKMRRDLDTKIGLMPYSRLL